MADYKGKIAHTGSQSVKAPYGDGAKKGKSSVKKDKNGK